jgi:hypothetical protein
MAASKIEDTIAEFGLPHAELRSNLNRAECKARPEDISSEYSQLVFYHLDTRNSIASIQPIKVALYRIMSAEISNDRMRRAVISGDQSMLLFRLRFIYCARPCQHAQL